MKKPRVFVVSPLTIILVLAVLFASCGLLRLLVLFIAGMAGGV